MTTAKESLQKAFGTSGNTSSAVHLSVEEASAFFDTIVNQSVLLPRVRTEKVDRATKNLQRLISNGEFLRAGTGNAGFNDADADTVDTNTIAISTKEVQGSIFVYDNEKRHNIEGLSIGEHVLNIAAKKAGNSIEKLCLSADTANAGFVGTLSAYKQLDGWIKRITNGGNFLNAENTSLFADAGVSREKFLKLYTSLNPQFRDMAEYFLHDNALVEYDELFTANFNRNTLMDNILGRPINKVPLMGITSQKSPVLFTDPKNLIVAFQVETASVQFEKFRNAKMKRDEYYLSMEIDTQVEVPEAASILANMLLKY